MKDDTSRHKKVDTKHACVRVCVCACVRVCVCACVRVCVCACPSRPPSSSSSPSPSSLPSLTQELWGCTCLVNTHVLRNAQEVVFAVPNNPKGFKLKKKDVPKPKKLQRQVRFTDTDLLMDCIVEGDADTVEKMLSQGTNPNSHDGDGMTPLHRSAPITFFFLCVCVCLEEGERGGH